MATVAEKTLTAEEFYDFANSLENRDRRFELENGEIVEMSLPGEMHCVVCGNTTGIFWSYTRRRNKGRVCPNDMGIILDRDPDTVRGPDVSVFTDSKSFVELERKYTDQLPTVMIEVMSPNDRIGRVIQRIQDFLAKGVPMVWLIIPESRSLTIFRAGKKPEDYSDTDELKNIPELPDFACRVAEFFEVPGA